MTITQNQSDVKEASNVTLNRKHMLDQMFLLASCVSGPESSLKNESLVITVMQQ